MQKSLPHIASVWQMFLCYNELEVEGELEISFLVQIRS